MNRDDDKKILLQSGPEETFVTTDGGAHSTLRPPVAAEKPASSGTRTASETPDVELAVQQSISRYLMRARLGAGSFGTVYRAYDPHLDIDVALKIPLHGAFRSDAERERFFREGRAAVTVRHPGICPVYDVGQAADGRCYLVLGYIEGESLGQRLVRLGIPSQQLAARWVRDIADAMAAAHQCGIIHRDLKPANVMLDLRERPVVMDFGLARRDSSNDATLTQEGQVLGTPAYMSPEQARGEISKVGPASDVYSLGAILYELLTGLRPYRGSAAAVISQLEKSNPPAPPKPSQINPEVHLLLENICLQAMHVDQSQRLPTMESLRSALDGWLDLYAAGTVIDANSTTVSLPTEPTTWRAKLVRSWKAWVVLTASVVCLATVFWINTRKGQVRIESNQPDLEIAVDGEEISFKNLGQPLALRTGRHRMEVKHGELVVETREFEVRKGQTTPLKVRYRPHEVGNDETTSTSKQSRTAAPQEPAPTSNSAEKLPRQVAAIAPLSVDPSENAPPAAKPWIPATDSERLAQWVLERHGQLMIQQGRNRRQIAGPDEIPATPWTLTGFLLSQPFAWTDEVRHWVIESRLLNYISLSDEELVDADYAAIAQLPDLTALTLTGGKTTPERLAILKPLTHLTSLQLHGQPIGDLEALKPFSKLTVFWMPGSLALGRSSTRVPLSLAGLDDFPAVGDLNVASRSLSTEDLAIIARQQRIHRLHLNHTNLTNEGLLQMINAPQLQFVFLDYTEVQDAAVTAFLEGTHDRLLGISLTHTAVTDDGLQTLSKCSKLIDLTLASTGIGDRTLEAAAACSNLSSLWLTHARVGDAGIKHLSGMPQLMTLDLSGTAITDESLPVLKTLRRLNFLGLQGTRISPAGLEQLRQALPNCQISW